MMGTIFFFSQTGKPIFYTLMNPKNALADERQNFRWGLKAPTTFRDSFQNFDHCGLNNKRSVKSWYITATVAPRDQFSTKILNPNISNVQNYLFISFLSLNYKYFDIEMLVLIKWTSFMIAHKINLQNLAYYIICL